MVYVYIIFVVFNMVFFLLLKQESEDTIANKTKTPFPKYDTSGIDGFMQNLENHYIDYFPFKYTYVSFSNKLKAKVFNNLSANNSVIVGKSGWLFYNSCVYDTLGMNEYAGYKPWNKDQLLKVTQNIKAIQSWCAKNHIKFEVIICPNKQSIYSEYLPSYYKKRSNSRYDQLMATFPNMINAKKMFLEFKKKSNQALYYRTDTHWNLFAGYLVCNELNRKLKTQFPLKNFNQIKLKSSIVNNGFDLANMLALKDDYIDFATEVEFKVPPIYKIPHLMVVHDSYLGFMETHLDYMFTKVTKRQLYSDGIPSPEVLLSSKTDVFVIELVERYKEILTGDIHPDFFK